MVNGFCQSTIIVDGFSMVFLHVNHWCQWFFNGFSDFNHWYQWFFQCFFSNPTIAIEWMVLWLTIDIDGLSMVLGKVKADLQKRLKNKKKA